ncbi:amino acid dehydrogenase [Pseudolabrys sp. Root1462]|uniref:NAD(P)/FAD-dependent oxidoreductase n=1 Tax=Pseudolabrys sp. Root1462 TaxID=1736466 RepID=UPI000702CFBD|nr:FAD-dependent oxidoreductase [Pseudolabrys sp. Root1462]KQZ00330.1 amino acid dehydrogenase [Pseudolabrys sp. Root1462]
MARTDVIVLGAGIVGTSIALQLAKRNMAVALIDRASPGEQTSYGNSGVIEGSTVMPPAFPSNFGALLRVALKQGSDANYHLGFLPWVAPWLMRFRAASQPAVMEETARINRPLFARSIAEHEALMLESGATQYLRRNGWIKLYRSDAAFAGLRRELDLARELGVPVETMDADGARKLEPSLKPVFRHATYSPAAVSLSDPLAVTKAYAARFATLGGVVLKGDASSLHRSGNGWRAETAEGPIDAPEVVVALGPWAPDLLAQFGIRLPMGFKRGYHRRFKTEESAPLTRPVVDVFNGYLITPMRQGIRVTTGVEFAPRDAAATPVQFDRLMPKLDALYRIGPRAEDRTWLGSRPCFPDSRPVIGRAPGQKGMWLAIGHAHWGLTLGPITGRLLGEMMSGETPFLDPKGFAAERFL